MTPHAARLGRLGLLVAAITLATMALGWLAPVFVGVVFVCFDGRDSVARESAMAAAAAWTLIFLITALGAGARPVGMIGAAAGMPVIVLPIASILFAAGLAWSSATLALVVRQAIAGGRGWGLAAEPARR